MDKTGSHATARANMGNLARQISHIDTIQGMITFAVTALHFSLSY